MRREAQSMAGNAVSVIAWLAIARASAGVGDSRSKTVGRADRASDGQLTDARLFSAHDQIWVVLRHDAVAASGEQQDTSREPRQWGAWMLCGSRTLGVQRRSRSWPPRASPRVSAQATISQGGRCNNDDERFGPGRCEMVAAEGLCRRTAGLVQGCHPDWKHWAGLGVALCVLWSRRKGPCCNWHRGEPTKQGRTSPCILHEMMCQSAVVDGRLVRALGAVCVYTLHISYFVPTLATRNLVTARSGRMGS